MRRLAVIIPCRNGAATVTRAVRSVLQGDPPPGVEVIVVDDGSTDGTAQVVEAIGDARVRVLRQEPSGVCAARNAGAASADADTLVFLDADDELLPGALRRYAAAVDGVAAPVARAAIVVDWDGERHTERPRPTDPVKLHPWGPKIPGSFAIDRNLFLSVGGYAPELRFGENTDLLLRLAVIESVSAWRTAIVDEPAALIHREGRARVRRHGDQPANAAEWVLSRYAHLLSEDPKILHNYRVVLGAHLLRTGEVRAARRQFVAALRCRPRVGRTWARLASTFLPATLRPATSDPGRPPLVVVVSPGAGRIRRGYEAFAIDLATQLSRLDGIRTVLLQGGPPSIPQARRVRHLDRHRAVAAAISRVTGLYPTSVEHYSFGLWSLPYLLRSNPDVVVLAERPLANLYGEAFRRLGRSTKVVLRNGGSHRPPFRHVDTVIHHTPAFLDAALAAPDDGVAHVHLPYAFELGPDLEPLAPGERDAVRTALGIPTDRTVVISVGALDSTVKHMDHVIDEVGSIDVDRPFVVLLGQREPETPAIERRAVDVLGRDGHLIATIPSEQVARYLSVADVFVLASPKEGFGRVYVEALAAGLPTIAHDTPHTRWVLGEVGRFVDMTERGALATAIREVLADPTESSEQSCRQRRRVVHERFSWDRLLPGYLDALGVQAPPPATGRDPG